MILSKKGITKALIRLSVFCSQTPLRQIFLHQGPYAADVKSRKMVKYMNLVYLIPFKDLMKSNITLAWMPENLSSRFVNNKGADQSAHLHSLISTFVIPLLERIISTSNISIF